MGPRQNKRGSSSRGYSLRYATRSIVRLVVSIWYFNWWELRGRYCNGNEYGVPRFVEPRPENCRNGKVKIEIVPDFAILCSKWGLRNDLM